MIRARMEPTAGFRYREGELVCDEVPLRKIAKEVGTPSYIYSAAAVRSNYRKLEEAFRDLDVQICYAVKANANLAVLALLRDIGASFDIVSGGELYRLEKLGVAPNRIVFSGVGKTRAELSAAVQMGLLCLNIESLEELRAVARQATEHGRPVRIALRVNPDVDAKTHPYISTGLREHKFGIPLPQLDELLQLLRSSSLLRLVGVGTHIGSQILDTQPFMDVFPVLLDLASALKSQGFPVEQIDVGGGFGIPYRGETPIELTRYATFLTERSKGFRVLMEPGRFIVGSAGVLLCRVLYTKPGEDKKFIVVDGAMNDLVRPALYNAYHEILPVKEGLPSQRADVVGPVCESADFLGVDRVLPELEPDDLLAVMNAGAYGFVSSSNYNSRTRAAEVLVAGAAYKVVRPRETYEDLVKGEVY